LNQIGTNSIKFISNSKIGAEFDFSFEFYWPLLPNILIYLQKKFYIFLRSISIFPKYISVSVLNRNSIRFFSKTFYSRAGPISRPTRSTIARNCSRVAWPIGQWLSPFPNLSARLVVPLPCPRTVSSRIPRRPLPTVASRARPLVCHRPVSVCAL
jgi:hypothetical protein